MLQAGSFSTRSWSWLPQQVQGPQTLPSGCAKVEDVERHREEAAGGDKELGEAADERQTGGEIKVGESDRQSRHR